MVWIIITFLFGCSVALSPEIITENWKMLSGKQHSQSSLIDGILHILGWKRVVAFTETENDNLMLPAHTNRMVSYYTLDDVQTETELRTVLFNLHDRFFPSLNFIIIANASSALETIQRVEQHDLTSNRTTDFCHFSRWVIFTFQPCPSYVLPRFQLMENIAIICYDQNNETVIWTLFILPSGRELRRGKRVKNLKNDHDIFHNLKYGLNNRTLTVSYIENHPYLNTTPNGFQGLFMDVLNTMAKALNFSYRLVRTKDMQYGFLSHGRWNGAIGELHRREVDLSIAALSINYEREEVMDFLYPPMVTIIDDMVYQMKQEREENWKQYLNPFTITVIVTLCSVYLAYSVVTSCVLRGEVWFQRNCKFGSKHQPTCMNEPENRTKDIGLLRGVSLLGDVTLHHFGLLLNRGVSLEAERWSSRLLIWTWGVFSVIIAACYCANLMAGFTVSTEKLPFTSFKEMVRQDEYRWGIPSGAAHELTFRNSKQPDIQRAWDAIVEWNKTDPEVLLLFDPSFEREINKVLSEKYAQLMRVDRAKHLMSRDCSIRRIGTSVLQHPLGFGVPTDYLLKEVMEKTLVKIMDNGLMNFWWGKWNPDVEDKCAGDKGTVTLQLVEVAPAFYILAIGTAAAGFILGLERCFQMIRNSRKTPN